MRNFISRERLFRFNSLSCVVADDLISNLADFVEGLEPTASVGGEPSVENGAVVENCFQTSGIVLSVRSGVSFWEIKSLKLFNINI